MRPTNTSQLEPETVYDYKRFAVLYVDDEEKSLTSFRRAFGDTFRIFTATTAQEGFSILQQHKDEIGVLMTDQRMPGEKGVWLLERARQLRPKIIRILVTAYSDIDAAIAAVNTGAIYKYVTKPWDPPQLEQTLKRGLEFFMVQRERDQLFKEKMSVLRNMMIADRMVSLGLLAAGLSHHIRNALVAVKTFLDLAPAKLQEENLDLDSLRNPDFWKEYYQNVQRQISKINALLNELWSATEPPRFYFNDMVNVRKVVEGVVSKLRDALGAKCIEVVNQIPEDLPPLKVDLPKFERLFELLLKDELVSLPPHTRVTLTARAARDELDGAEEVRIEVSDNGPGMPKEAVRLLFDPFVLRTDSPMEYGINLMACYFIAYHHGGTIDASSEPGRGTTFILRFPTDPNRPRTTLDQHQFYQRMLLNDAIWEKLIASY
ncbi:MAG: hybrid sensor histidine kinase/response regulator [Verrucomicrobiae bacterium]|nr:hybrid sensor histidine kinase/response regulator [Verrucomicrobiae bacterium]MCX7722174.1 hybrid sensor histidine kinase/response regulator [Verrucomicrobiae bacterium]